MHPLLKPPRACQALCSCLLCFAATLALAQEPPDALPPAAPIEPGAEDLPAWQGEQDLSDGSAVHGVRGGRYGAVRIDTDDPALQPAATRWIRDLRPGEPIDEKLLQRRLNLLKELPGVNSKAMLGPGEEGGLRDLTVTLQRKPRYSGFVALDNHGSRFTGDQRVRFGLDVPSLWTLGDSLSLQGHRRWHGTWNIFLGYTVPLGVNGWSLHAELDHNYYQLHRERRGLNAQGTSDILLVELSYPLWLDEAGSLQASVGVERTHSDDSAMPRGKAPVAEHRTLNMLPLKLNGEYRGDKSKTSGELMLGLGRLKLDHGLRDEDRSSARTEGRYRLLSADLRHEQTLHKDWTLWGRFSGQKASRNLDSEKWFAASGPQRIRAWTSAEAQGDEGWLLQMELRHRMGRAEPFVFVDAGQVKLRRRPWRRADNWRSLSGAGAGLRWTEKTWSAQAAVAWRTGGHRPGSRLGYKNPRIWLAATYRF